MSFFIQIFNFSNFKQKKVLLSISFQAKKQILFEIVLKKQLN